MTIDYQEDRAVFSEVVEVGDADALLDWLQRHPAGAVDLTACTHVHAASLQVLMCARAPVISRPTDPALATWIESALRSGR